MKNENFPLWAKTILFGILLLIILVTTTPKKPKQFGVLREYSRIENHIIYSICYEEKIGSYTHIKYFGILGMTFKIK